MAQYHITLNAELLHGLFTRDEGLAKLLEQVLNQILDYFGIISTRWTIKASKKKKHVLCEKPAALCEEDVRCMIQQARALDACRTSMKTGEIVRL
ncbi:transposase [Geobacillus stearothermophilus]|nr:transposase [Geobacillus stearothermophilus]